MKTWQFFDFFSLSLLGTENMQKHFFAFSFVFFSFHFLAIYVQYAKARDISADSNQLRFSLLTRGGVQHTPMPTCTYSLKLGSLELPISPAYTQNYGAQQFSLVLDFAGRVLVRFFSRLVHWVLLSPIPSHTFEGLADSNRQEEYYLSSHCYMFLLNKENLKVSCDTKPRLVSWKTSRVSRILDIK